MSDERGRRELQEELPEDLRALDAQFDQLAAETAPTMSPELRARIAAAVAQERLPNAPASTLGSLRRGSIADSLWAFRASLRSVYGRRVPLAVRAQAIALLVVASILLAAGATVAATGLAEVVRVVREAVGVPLPTVPPESSLVPSPTGAPGATGSPTPSPSGVPGSPSPGASTTPTPADTPRASGSPTSPTPVSPGDSATSSIPTTSP